MLDGMRRNNHRTRDEKPSSSLVLLSRATNARNSSSGQQQDHAAAHPHESSSCTQSLPPCHHPGATTKTTQQDPTKRSKEQPEASIRKTRRMIGSIIVAAAAIALTATYYYFFYYDLKNQEVLVVATNPSSKHGEKAAASRTKFQNEPAVVVAAKPTATTTEHVVVQESLLSLNVVSMNIIECRPSAEAPSHWDVSNSTAAIRSEILKSHPDIIALQEAPQDDSWAEQVFQTESEEDSYISMGKRATHAGYVRLWLKSSLLLLATEQQPVLVALPPSIPAIMARIPVLHHNLVLYVASVHLQPFASGANTRKEQIKKLLLQQEQFEIQGGHTDNNTIIVTLIMGDTNMREWEDEKSIMEDENTPTTLQDAWKLAGSDPRTQYTWDTVDHGTSFNSYYGEDTRQYTTRYDRLYINKKSSTTDRAVVIKVDSFELIANHPIPPSTRHFLSDHFGIQAQLSLVL